MRGKLIPVGLNELLGSPLSEPFKLRFVFDPFPDIQFNSLLYAKRPTPELTRAEHTAFKLIGEDNDERDATEASG